MNTILPLFRRSVTDTWRSTLGWSLGIAATVFLYLPLYPSIGGNSDMADLLEQLPAELVNTIGYDAIGTGPGYTQSTIFGLLGFVLVVIAATSWSTSAIAGDEETGSLELTLAHGVSRTQLVLERSAAILLRLLWLGALTVALVMIVNGPAGLELNLGNLVATSAALVGLGLLSAGFGLAVGAITGRRVFATAAAAGVAVVAYALNAIANNSEDLDALHDWSPYGWAYHNSPLTNGPDVAGLALLYGVSVALILIAVLALNRRDIAN